MVGIEFSVLHWIQWGQWLLHGVKTRSKPIEWKLTTHWLFLDIKNKFFKIE